MISTIVYIIGVVLAIAAVIDIFKKPISLVGKIIVAVIVLATSWIGLLLYYLWAKDNLTKWFK
jgi:ABC-type tungstate transport system substrate-binding protein